MQKDKTTQMSKLFLDKNKLLKVIGERIRQFRILKGLSQENMASDLGISTNAYGKYERGQTDINITRMAEICELFNVSFEEFFSFDKKIFSKHNIYLQDEINTEKTLDKETYKEKIEFLAKENHDLRELNITLKEQVQSLKEENQRLKKKIRRLEVVELRLFA